MVIQVLQHAARLLSIDPRTTATEAPRRGLEQSAGFSEKTSDCLSRYTQRQIATAATGPGKRAFPDRSADGSALIIRDRTNLGCLLQ